MEYDLTCLNIDLDIIADNFARVKQLSKAKVLAVVKADAYGHGAIQISTLLEPECDYFGVSSIQEAMELLQAGIQKPILILGYTPVSAYPIAVQDSVRMTIYDFDDAKALSQAAQALGKTAYVHLAVDTGMGRIGFQANSESADLCVKISRLPNICVEGLFSHFATADCPDLSQAKEQMELFDSFDAMLKQRGLHVPIRHMDNSAGLMNFPGKYEMVRSGIVTYGMYPSKDVDPQLLPVRPALQWVSRVSHVKRLPAGKPISYGGTYVTSKETVIATVPTGYADGYRQSLSGRFYVLIRGKRAPIVGRICMDQLMVDVTDIPDVQVFDLVTLVGTDGTETITMEDLSAAAGSFNYEFVCGVSRRVPKVYFQNGRQVAHVHHLFSNRVKKG